MPKPNFASAVLLGAAASLSCYAGSFEDASRSYSRTDYADAIQQLRTAEDARSLRLLGQSYVMSGENKRATDVLERAIALDPQNSDGYLWLGRAYGHRAESAFPIAAPALAVKARQNLEKAVALDPRNWPAVDDLFEYYLEAPAFLGGGAAKALKVADHIATHDAAEAASDRARVAESQKNFAAAEAQFRRAITLAPQQTSRTVDLAKFLARRGRYAESDQMFAAALAADSRTPRFLFSRANALIEANRNLPEARHLLERYLSMSLSPEDPPRGEAQRLLRKLSD